MKTNYMIKSNGSKWAGQEPDTLETLAEMLKIWELEDWSFTSPKQRTIFGNFKRYSHVFSVVFDDDKLFQKYQRLIYKNRKSNLA